MALIEKADQTSKLRTPHLQKSFFFNMGEAESENVNEDENHLGLFCLF